MQNGVNSVEAYINNLPKERQEPVKKLRNIFVKNLPKGFEEGIQYGMIGYYVPHTIYPKGYHCKPIEPLPFIHIASQKNSISVYHMGIYAMPNLYDWFVEEYPKHSRYKLDMGKSCIRFKKTAAIPYDLLIALAKKVPVATWLKVYEKSLKHK